MIDSISEIEKIIGIPLPEDVRSYYVGNLTILDLPCEIDVPHVSPWIDEVDQLYSADDALGILQEDLKSVEYEIREVPAGTIPLGDNGSGDYYVASIRESDFGLIYYMFHEVSDPMDESLKGAILLATSFSEWVCKFRPMPTSSSSQS